MALPSLRVDFRPIGILVFWDFCLWFVFYVIAFFIIFCVIFLPLHYLSVLYIISIRMAVSMLFLIIFSPLLIHRIKCLFPLLFAAKHLNNFFVNATSLNDFPHNGA